MSTAPENSVSANVSVLSGRVAKHLLFGFLVVLAFFGGFGYWASTAPIYGAAIANGTVSTEKARRTIQHLEGGVIKDILVNDGDRVVKDQRLILLDDTRALAQVEQQSLLILSFKAELERLRQEARYITEQDLSLQLEFSNELVAGAADVQGAAEMLEFQKSHFVSRQAALSAADELSTQTILGYEVQIDALVKELDSIDRQLDLLAEEGDVLRSMRERGLERRAPTAENLIKISQTEQLKHERQGRILTLTESISEVRLEAKDTWARELEATTSDMLSVAQSLLDAQVTYAAYLDTLERTVITAPVSGTLIELSVNTEGAVVEAGDTVVEIVPTNEALTIEARIDPNDIDVVVPGLSASVVLLAYPRRNLPRLEGKLESVSADSITDSATGETYYLGRITIEQNEIARLGEDVALLPGMSVEVFLQTPARTFIDYLFEPVFRYSDRAFREA